MPQQPARNNSKVTENLNMKCDIIIILYLQLALPSAYLGSAFWFTIFNTFRIILKCIRTLTL